MVLGERDYRIEIFNLSGETKLQSNTTAGQVFDVSALLPGMYLIKLTDIKRQETSVQKLIKL